MMRQVEENIEMLSRAVSSEAQAEADRILAEARGKAEGVRNRAKEQAEEERKEILDRARQEADRLRGQAMATTQMKARTQQLERREKLLDQVFEKSQKQLSSIQKWTEYPEIANQLLREALRNVQSSAVVVRADPVTQNLIGGRMLKDLCKELNLEIEPGEPLERGTGIVVQSADGHLSYDNTLETRLARMQNGLRSPVYRLLMGEPL